ncbi:MAG: TonB-dependent receptor, partial [Burkholderiales bacterium]
MKRTTYYLFASAIALSSALPAFAQVAEPPQAAPAEAEQAAPTRDVVVITANKREETVQDIAVAVTALTAEAKEQLGVISVTDLTNVTPGLSYTPGNERITLRGIGRLTNSFGADPGVANYNDGIYTPFAVMAGKDPTLIQRVEVLRGPQGTLYGRNAIGGAINTISKRPADDFTADFKLGLGSYDYRNIVAAVSGPITDSLRYRVAGQREQRNGVDFNYGTGHDEGWEIDDYYYEGQLEGEIGDRFSWWLKVADSGYDKAGPPGGRTATFSTAPILGTFAPSGGSGVGPGFAYSNPSVVGFTQTGNRRDNPFATNGEHAYNTNYASTAHLDKYDEAIFEAVYETDWFDIKYTGGYTFYDYKLYSDADGTPIQSVTYNAINGRSIAGPCALAGTSPLNGFPTSTLTSVGLGGCITSTTQNTIYPNVLNLYGEQRAMFSNEINLISTTDGPLSWIVGAYQYQENSEQPGQVQTLDNEPLADRYFNLGTGAFIDNPDRYLQYFGNTSLFHAYGLYGQADYTLNDQLKFTFGLRYSKDIKESKEEGFLACYIICNGSDFDPGPGTFYPPSYTNITAVQYGAAVAASPGAYYDERGFAIRRLKGDWEAVTGVAGVEYRPWDDTLTFLKYSRGYKAGGFNNLGFGASPYTDPEFVDSYEAGWKQTRVDFGLTTNAALFLYKYTDAQAPLSEITTVGGTQTATTRFVN